MLKLNNNISMLCASLSPQHGMYSGCIQRKWPTDVEGRLNMLTKQSWRTADEGWSSSLEVG